MKSISTLLFFIIIILSEAVGQEQSANDIATRGVAPTPIVIRCKTSITWESQPLVVVDGIVIEKLDGLNPDDIESITVLKNEAATSLCGNRANNGCILVTTKKKPELIIRDAVSKETIPFCNITISNGKRIINTHADENGKVQLKQFNLDGSYRLNISSVGYITHHIWDGELTQRKNNEIFLQRDIIQNEEVILSDIVCVKIKTISYSHNRMSRCENTLSDLTELKAKNTGTGFSIYPNPVLRGNIVNLQIADDFSAGSLMVFDISGRRLFQQSIIGKENRLISFKTDGKWTAGTYILNLFSSEGKKLVSSKLIVQ